MFFEIENFNEVFGEPELDAGGDIEDDGHGEGSDQIHFALDQFAEHVGELVFFLVFASCFVLLLESCYKAFLVVLQHCLVQFLAKLPARVELLV